MLSFICTESLPFHTFTAMTHPNWTQFSKTFLLQLRFKHILQIKKIFSPFCCSKHLVAAQNESTCCQTLLENTCKQKRVQSLKISELSKYAQIHLRPFFLLLLTDKTARPNLLTMQSWQSSNISPRIFGRLLLARVPNPFPKRSESS